jgi:hypothetical protein
MTKSKSVPNMAAELTKAMATGEFDDDSNPNISTEDLPKNEILDTRAYQDAAAARAAIAPHMAYANTASEPNFSEKIKDEFKDLAAKMKVVKLPDLRVNVLGTKSEIPGSALMHGNLVNHRQAIDVLVTLLGPARVAKLHKLATRANQEHKPILWLVQQFAIELSQPYTHKIFQEVENAKIELPLTSAPEVATEAIHEILSYEISQKLDNCALNNRMEVYPLFIYIIDTMLERHLNRLKVSAVASTWDAIREFEDAEAKTEKAAREAV